MPWGTAAMALHLCSASAWPQGAEHAGKVQTAKANRTILLIRINRFSLVPLTMNHVCVYINKHTYLFGCVCIYLLIHLVGCLCLYIFVNVFRHTPAASIAISHPTTKHHRAFVVLPVIPSLALCVKLLDHLESRAKWQIKET